MSLLSLGSLVHIVSKNTGFNAPLTVNLLLGYVFAVFSFIAVSVSLLAAVISVPLLAAATNWLCQVTLSVSKLWEEYRESRFVCVRFKI